MDHVDATPVAGLTFPTQRVLEPSALVERAAVGQEGLIEAGMALAGGDEADGAVTVRMVVPLHQLSPKCVPRLSPRTGALGIQGDTSVS